MSEINSLAYVKMFLHLAKYPELSVNGVLLSERSNASSDEVDSSSYLHFVDCIPLFHGVLSLSPMLEIALTQIDAYCSTRNLSIAGYYHANENYEDTNPSLTATKQRKTIFCRFCQCLSCLYSSVWVSYLIPHDLPRPSCIVC